MKRIFLTLSISTFLLAIGFISKPENPILAKNIKNESAVKPFGTFMKVNTDGEHAHGYNIQLWKQDGKFLGLISYHRGLMGDPPAGLLENVQFDSKTGKFSFRAKLTTGEFYDKTHNGVPSQDIFEFSGILTAKRITGVLKMTNELCADKCPEKRVINLPRSREWSEGLDNYQSHAEWKKHADMILNFRGPRW